MKEVTIKMSEKELAEVNKALGALGKKIVPEEFKKSKKVDIEPEEPFNYTDEREPYAAEINGGGWVFIHSSFFEDANMADVNDVQVFANKTDIYLTDLRRDQIDWEDNEVENWGSTARNFAGDLGIEVSEIWNCVNPYGDTCTINVSDHFINIHYTGDGVYEEEEDPEPREFTITTDAEGRATLNKEILEAADLINSVVNWSIFKNDSGTKMYITWNNDPYLDFDGEVCTNVKNIPRNGKTALRIKIGEPYSKYKVTTTGEEDNELITIDLNSGVLIDDDDLTMDQIDKRVSKMNKEERESEETVKKIKEYADKKIREDKEQEELKKKAEELVYQIFNDVEKIKAMTGLDLSNIITKVVKAILSGKKVF